MNTSFLRIPPHTAMHGSSRRIRVLLFVLLLPRLSLAFSSQFTKRGHLFSPLLVQRTSSSNADTLGSLTRLYESSPENKKNANSPNRKGTKLKHEPKPAHPNDPRAYRRNRRILRELNEANYKRAKQQVQKRKRDEQQAAVAFDLPEQPLVRTIGGGTAMIFAMAQRMFEQQQSQLADDEAATTTSRIIVPPRIGASPLLPRWRPAAGIANENPSFRTASPNMNNQGYAGVIWRNVRKRNKPSLYKYALRTYDRMTNIPATTSSTPTTTNENGPNGAGAAAAGSDVIVQPTNIHHEGALVAAAKLGLWERALNIYNRVQEEEALLRKRHGGGNNNGSGNGEFSKLSLVTQKRYSVHVTEHMVGSVVRACVRACRNNKQASLQERRKPLDQARAILAELPNRHDIYLDAHHVNPLAAAYQAIGLRHEANEVLDAFLGDRVIGPEPETGGEMLNIHDLGCKDKASYALRVQGAVSAEDWGAAVEALMTMTEAGLYPVERHLNVWTEVSERKTKHRATRSWKKKRDQSWVLRTVPSQ